MISEGTRTGVHGTGGKPAQRRDLQGRRRCFLCFIPDVEVHDLTKQEQTRTGDRTRFEDPGGGRGERQLIWWVCTRQKDVEPGEGRVDEEGGGAREHRR